MGFFTGVGKVVKPFVDVKGWFGYTHVRGGGEYIGTIVKNLCTLSTEGPAESFETAVINQGLNEEKLATLKKAYIRQTFIYGVFTLGIILYFAYLCWLKAWLAAFVSFLMIFVTGVSTVRAHFWVYQLKKRQLGCSFKAYFTDIFSLLTGSEKK